jgi:hypothetical protein
MFAIERLFDSRILHVFDKFHVLVFIIEFPVDLVAFLFDLPLLLPLRLRLHQLPFVNFVPILLLQLLVVSHYFPIELVQIILADLLLPLLEVRLLVQIGSFHLRDDVGPFGRVSSHRIYFIANTNK